MGEIADAYLDGVFCQECGEYLGEGCGHGRLCADCKKGRSAEKTDRVAASKVAFPEAKELASENGMTLIACKGYGAQYNLSHPDGWLIQFYPSNRRIYSPKGKRGTFLSDLAFEITILDVVNAAIAAKAGA